MLEKFKNHTPLQEGIETMQEIASKNFNKWNDTLQSGNSKEVAALYSADATFLPTVSAESKNGQVGAEEYFKHFLEKNPMGEILEEAVQALGIDYYLHCGMYNFKVGPADNRQIIEARFSFVWKKDDQGNWTIIHHHSSIKPKG